MTGKATLPSLLALSLATAAFGQPNNNYNMSASLTSISDCTGFFMDSGGGSGSYGANQNFTTTICSDGTVGTHMQLVFSGTVLGPGDDLCFFDGQTTAAPSLGCASDFGGNQSFVIQATAANPSGCITVTFTSDATGQAAGWSADMNCIASCQTILSVLETTDPPAVPADTGWIDICPGERVFFTGSGSYPQNGLVYNHSDLTSNFEWDFGDGVITYGPNVSHPYEESGGYVVQLTITDTFGCKNTNFISQRIRVAPRPDFEIGPYPLQICAGDTVHLSDMVDSIDLNHTVSVIPNEEGFQTAAIRSDSLPLPDGNGNSYETTLSFNNFSPGQTLTDINDLIGIWLTMEHSWMRDIEIDITCPNGQNVVLHNFNGQVGGEVFLGIPYEADEGAAVPIPGTGGVYGWQVNPDYNYTWIQYANTFTPNTLPEGSYNSYDPLTDLLGCPLNGDWTIQVTDLWPIDNGYIFSWSIEFDPSLYPDIETFSPDLVSWGWNPHPSIFMSTPDSLAGSPVNAGEVAYTFTVDDSFGCSWDTTVNIQVLPFTHPDCHECEDNLTPVPDTTVCMGQPVAMNAFANVQPNTNVTFESYPDYAIGAGNHPPNNPYVSTINVNSISPMTITNPAVDIISVCLDLETDFDADINLHLRAPNGNTLMLSTGNGGSGDNYKITCFTPTAVQNIVGSAAPFNGSFQPEGPWNVLNGAPINGAWQLRVSDAFGLNSYGTLKWWSITFRSVNNVTYSWSPSTGLTCTNCPNPTATPPATATYVVSSNDSYNCTATDTVTINVLNSFTAPTVTCQQQPGGEIVVSWNDVSPGLGYEVNINGTGWTAPNNGSLSHLVSGLVNGDIVNVQVQVDVNGATCTVGVGSSSCEYLFCPIDVQPVTPAPYAVTCFGNCDESVQIAVTGGDAPYNFTITNQTTGGTTMQASDILANLCPGTYQVAVEDAMGCLDTLAFAVGEPSDISVAASQTSQPTCFGGSNGCAQVLATGGVGGFTYLWGNQNMSTTQNVCGLSAGAVSVTATDANGCQETTSATITEPLPITPSISHTDVLCKNGATGTASVTATGGTGAGTYTFQWSGGTTPTAATTGGLAAGIYSVTVTDGNGCQAFENVVVGEPATGIQVQVVQTQIGCYGEADGQASATATGGQGAYTYNWLPSGQSDPLAVNLIPQTYSVVVTDENGCTATDDVLIDEWDIIQISISFVPPSCHGSADGEMAANIVTGGNGTYGYSWNTGATEVFVNNLQGGLTYTVTVSDSQGCTGMLSRFLEDPPAIVVTTEATDTKCHGSTDGTGSVATVENSKGTLTYLWNPAASSQTTAVADSLSPGTYSVVVTDTAGCTGSGLVTVGEPPALEADFETIDNECFGDVTGSVDADVSGGAGSYTFLWSNGAATQKITGLPADKYFVTITDANGCTLLDSAFVSAPEPVDADIIPKDVSCFGEKDGSITIVPDGGTPPFTYSLDGVNFYGSSTLIALEAGDYTVSIRDGNGCVFASETTLGEPPLLELLLLSNGLDLEELMIPDGESVNLSASVSNANGLVSYAWSAAYYGTLFFGATSDCDTVLNFQGVTSTPQYTNDYFVRVEDENGCSAEDHVQIHVKKERRVVVPTGFTPNADGQNDLLTVHGKSGTMVKHFQVFDRWGELLYEHFDVPINEPSIGWDGTFKGKEMMAGVYVWYLEAEYEDGMKEAYKGETTLIR